MLLLQLLKDQDMYGYQMIEELRKRSQDVFEMKVGTLYPLLHSLEKSGFLQSYEGEAAGKKRIYYQITKDGRQELERKKGEWVLFGDFPPIEDIELKLSKRNPPMGADIEAAGIEIHTSRQQQ